MRKNLAGIYVIFSLLLPSVSFAGEFCRVRNFGSTGPCFPTLSACEFGLIGSGTCVFRDTSASSASPAPGSFDEAYQVGRGLGLLLKALIGEPQGEKEAAKESEIESSAQLAERNAQLAERQYQQEEDRRNADLMRQRSELLSQQHAAQARRERIPEIEKTCADIGFKKRTPAFGDCVLDLYERLR